MKEGSEVKGGDERERRKRMHLHAYTYAGRTRKGERDKETFYWKQHDESEGSERVSRKEGREDR